MSEMETVKLAESNTLLPNLTICVEKDELDDDTLPNIEYSDPDTVKMENIEEKIETDVKIEMDFSRKKIYENKRLKNFQDLAITEEEFLKKKEERAKRFDSSTAEDVLNQSEDKKIKIAKICENLKTKICDYNKILMENDPTYIRPDALFLHGVNHMNTDQIYDYFDDLNPNNIEWLNDMTCNVVWYDDAKVIPSFTNLTYIEKKLEEKVEKVDDSLDLTDNKNDEIEIKMDIEEKTEKEEIFENKLIDCTKVFKNFELKIRFAEIGDKKNLGAGKKSKFYQKYGNPHYGGAKGVLSGTYKKRYQMKRSVDELKNFNVVTNKRQKIIETSPEMEMEDDNLLNTTAKDLRDAIPVKFEDEKYSTMVADRVSRMIDHAKIKSSIRTLNGDLKITKNNSNILSRLGKKNEIPDSEIKRESTVSDRLPRDLRHRLGKKTDQKKTKNFKSKNSTNFLPKNDQKIDRKEIRRGSPVSESSDDDLDLN